MAGDEKSGSNAPYQKLDGPSSNKCAKAITCAKVSAVMITLTGEALWMWIGTEWQLGNGTDTYMPIYTTDFELGRNDSLTSGQYNNPYEYAQWDNPTTLTCGVAGALIGPATLISGSAAVGYAIGELLTCNFRSGLKHLVLGAGFATLGYFTTVLWTPQYDWDRSNHAAAAHWVGYDSGFTAGCQLVPNHGCANSSVTFATDARNNTGHPFREMGMLERAQIAGYVAFAAAGLGFLCGLRGSASTVRKKYCPKVCPDDDVLYDDGKVRVTRDTSDEERMEAGDARPKAVVPAAAASAAPPQNPSGCCVM